MDFKEFFKNRRNTLLVSIFASTVLYLLGIRFPFLLIVVGINCLLLPMPSVFRTLASRLFLSIVATFSLIVMAGAIQYVFFSGTDFRLIAIIVAIAEVGLVLYSPIKNNKIHHPLFTKQDLVPLFLSTLTFVPFIGLLFSNDTLAQILIFANAQVIDAGNHFSSITHFFNTQFLSLQNYPSGFYFGFAFMYNAFVNNLYEFGWRANLVSYFAQYVIMCSVFVYAVYYFVLGLAESYGSRFRRPVIDKAGGKLLLAFTVIPSIILFYNLPFIAQGFLNYFYVIAAFLCGILYLLNGLDDEKKEKVSRWSLFAFLVLGFSIGSSWSPLIPLVLGIAFLYVIPRRINVGVIKSLLGVNNIPILLVLIFYFVLFYAQISSVDVTGHGGMFEDGNLHDLHYLILLPATLLIGYLLIKSKSYGVFERVLFSVFATSILFVLCFAILHYFRIGEIRYYPIKIALLIEIFCLCLASVVLVVNYLVSKNRDWRKSVTIPALSLAVVAFAVMTGGNPIGPVRELFKPLSGIPMPEYIQRDAQKIVELGSEGRIKHNNVIAIHYNFESQKMDGYPQLIYRANLMTRQKIGWEYETGKCMNSVNFLLESATPLTDVGPMVKKINECINMLKEHDTQYFIVTDEKTADFLKSRIDQSASLVY